MEDFRNELLPWQSYVTVLYEVPIRSPTSKFAKHANDNNNNQLRGVRKAVLQFHSREALIEYLYQIYQVYLRRLEFAPTSLELPALQIHKSLPELLHFFQYLDYLLPLSEILHFAHLAVLSAVVNNQLVLPDPSEESHFLFDFDTRDEVQLYLDSFLPALGLISLSPPLLLPLPPTPPPGLAYSAPNRNNSPHRLMSPVLMSPPPPLSRQPSSSLHSIYEEESEEEQLPHYFATSQQQAAEEEEEGGDEKYSPPEYKEDVFTDFPQTQFLDHKIFTKNNFAVRSYDSRNNSNNNTYESNNINPPFPMYPGQQQR
jgi:hypothetical protein